MDLSKLFKMVDDKKAKPRKQKDSGLQTEKIILEPKVIKDDISKNQIAMAGLEAPNAPTMKLGEKIVTQIQKCLNPMNISHKGNEITQVKGIVQGSSIAPSTFAKAYQDTIKVALDDDDMGAKAVVYVDDLALLPVKIENAQ